MQLQLLSFSAAVGGQKLRIVANKYGKTDFLQERNYILINLIYDH